LVIAYDVAAVWPLAYRADSIVFLLLKHFYCECIGRGIAKKTLINFNGKYNSLIKLKASLIISAVVYLPNLWVNYIQLVSLI
jgi:hypothetical protein